MILILERNEAPNADVSENAEETSAPECPKSPKSPIVKTILVKSLDCNYVEGCSLDHLNCNSQSLSYATADSVATSRLRYLDVI